MESTIHACWFSKVSRLEAIFSVSFMYSSSNAVPIYVETQLYVIINNSQYLILKLCIRMDLIYDKATNVDI